MFEKLHQVGLLSSHFRRCDKWRPGGLETNSGMLGTPWRLKPSRLEQEAWQLLLNLPKTGDNEFGIRRNASISDHVDTLLPESNWGDSILHVPHFRCSASSLKTATPRTLRQVPGEMETCLIARDQQYQQVQKSRTGVFEPLRQSSPTATKQTATIQTISRPCWTDVSVPKYKRNKAARTRWSSPAWPWHFAWQPCWHFGGAKFHCLYGPWWTFMAPQNWFVMFFRSETIQPTVGGVDLIRRHSRCDFAKADMNTRSPSSNFRQPNGGDLTAYKWVGGSNNIPPTEDSYRV